MGCGNMMKVKNRALVLAAGKHLSVATLAGIDFNKNEDIWEMADVLKEKADSRQSYSKLEKSYGLKYNPHGFLYNIALREIHRPIDHHLRDWMHILVSGGQQTHKRMLSPER